MCGIWTIINNSYNNSDIIKNLLNNFWDIKHRGPDNSNLINIDNTFIGFHRLAIMDTSFYSNQPYFLHDKRSGSEDHTIVFICNGEIYNFKELDTKFSLIINEIIKSYSIYKMNPDYPEYQNLYSSNMSNLEKTKSDIFLLQNSLENDNQKIIDYITIADTKIEQLQDENNILKSKFKYLYESNNTADGLIDETQYLYNMKLLELFVSLVGIVVILVFIKKE